MKTIRISGIFRLAPPAADSYERMRADSLPSGGINSAWRSTDGQRRLFLSRYQPTKNRFTDRGPFGDVRKYEGVWYKRMRSYPVSVPGTSKHNQGLAIDTTVGKPVYTWLMAHGKGYGWSRPLVSVDPVHWEYDARKDKEKRRKKHEVYLVTAGVLHGRDAPSLTGRIVTRKKRGSAVVITGWAKGDGLVWGKSIEGIYFAKEFLAKRG
jgi:hypothetical protein